MFEIIGTGSYLPEKVVTNFDLEKIVDTSDEWIRERTGISERRIVVDNQTNSDIAKEACLKALKSASLNIDDIEMIILGTSTPDYPIPAMAPIVQYKLGCKKDIPAFDLNSVCSSFVYALLVGIGFLNSGLYENCLVIGSDVYSRILNWEDRTTCCIFGDGAGAVVIKKNRNKKGLFSYEFGARGEGANLIILPTGGSNFPAHKYNEIKKENLYFKMTGLDVYEFTVTTIPVVVENLIKKSRLTKDEVDWIILHQANVRIIESVSKKTKIPFDKFIVNIEKVANTSSASIPIALDEAVRDGRIKKGNNVMCVGFGGGLSWGGIFFEW